MSEVKHSPGPWQAEYIGVNGSFTIASKDGEFVICSRNPFEHRAAESRANAVLIATAPDYDDAAECFIRWVEHFKDKIPESVRGAMESAFGGKLRAAIKKARG